MEYQVFTSVRFKIIRDGFPAYEDVIQFSPEEYTKKSKKQIEALIEERYQTWRTNVSTPSVEVSKEQQVVDIEKDLASLDETRIALTSKKQELQQKGK